MIVRHAGDVFGGLAVRASATIPDERLV